MDFALSLAHRIRRLPAFALLGWAMLLVVLLSAAPSGAEPRTRLVGSAFDPASVSFALGRKQTDEKARIAPARDDGQPGDAPGAPPLPAMRNGTAAVPMAEHRLRCPVLPRMRTVVATASPSGHPHGPRAPPA